MSDTASQLVERLRLSYAKTPTTELFYAGIGSRTPPPRVAEVAHQLARRLAGNGHVLRSGGAIGMDNAFRDGARSVGGETVILRPAPLRLVQDEETFHASREVTQLAAYVHPAWHACTNYARERHRRNVQIVLGERLEAPVRFVLCWTRDAAVEETTIETGGTGQAIRIANLFDIPVWNLSRDEHFTHWTETVFKL